MISRDDAAEIARHYAKIAEIFEKSRNSSHKYLAMKVRDKQEWYEHLALRGGVGVKKR